MAALAAAVALALAAFTAAARRPDVEAELARLTAAGATRGQLAVFATSETALLAAGSVAAGWVASVAVTALAAAAAGAPAGPVLREAQLSGTGAAVTAAAFAAALAVLSLPALHRLRPGARTALEAAMVAAAAALAWQAAARGALGPTALAARPADPALLVLPGVALAAVAALLSRLVPPLVRGAERAARGRPLSVRLAALSLSRHPQSAAAVTACLLAAIGVAVFAGSYRHALARADADAAAAAVPACVTVPGVATALRGLPVGAAGAQGAVIRTRAELVGSARPVRLAGVPTRVLAAAEPPPAGVPARILRRLAAGARGGAGPLRLAGDRVPADARALLLPLEAEGSAVIVALAFQRPDGRFERLTAPQLPPGRHGLRLRVPPRLRGGRLVAVEVTVPIGAGAQSDRGAVRLGVLRARTAAGDRLPVSAFACWTGGGQARIVPGAGGATIAYRLLGSTGPLSIHRVQSAGGQPIPAVVSPGLAGEALDDGTLQVTAGTVLLTVRVVGTAARFPTVDGPFVVADARRLYAAANGELPGALTPTETWATPGAATAALARARRRDGVLAARRAEPLGVALRAGLLGLWVVACGAGVAVLVFALTGWLSERRGELVELEAAGVTPRGLRRQLAVALALLAGAGTAGGLVGGWALAHGLGAVLEIAADGTAPPVPVGRAVDPVALALTVAAVLGAAAAVIALRLRGAFAAPRPGRL
ncbi:MAG TPA: FtsX-like permease family protein [Solirubrobacteraceae bacterium]